MTGALTGRVAMVTGGSSGVGRAVSLELARRGACVAVTGRTDAHLERVLAELDEVSPAGRHFGARADVRSAPDLEHVVHRTLSMFGKLDALVVSAGVAGGSGRSLPYSVADMPGDAWDEVIQTNLTGAFLSIQAVLPAMREQSQGDIIVISSARAGRRGSAYAAAYCASKFGLNALAGCASEELATYGIRLQVVSPDLTATPMLVSDGGQRLPGKAMAPERVASLVAYLLAAPADVVHRDALIAASR